MGLWAAPPLLAPPLLVSRIDLGLAREAGRQCWREQRVNHFYKFRARARILLC